MLATFRKRVEKSYLTGILPSMLFSWFISLIAGIWPAMKEQADLIAGLLEDPMITSLFGQWDQVGMTQWEQMFFFIYLFVSLG